MLLTPWHVGDGTCEDLGRRMRRRMCTEKVLQAYDF